MQTTQDVRSIKPGDQIWLTDEQSIKDLIEDGADDAMEGLQLEVHQVRHIRESRGLADWYFAKLTGYKIPLTFMAKIVDQEMDLRIYYQPDDIESGNRQDQIDQGNFWLFTEPEDKGDFIPAKLEMASVFDQTIDDVGRVEFSVKGGALHGELRERPIPAGVPQPQFVSITEYSAGEYYDRIENPELVVLEIGGLDEDGDQLVEGGLITVFQGANVDPNDLSLMSV
jgi:hypothetical protein